MSNGMCDYAGCTRFGEQRVSFDKESWDDSEYCSEHLLPSIDGPLYEITRPAVNAEG